MIFFDYLPDSWGETKKRHQSSTWPLQMMLLVLTPKVLEEIYNADTGAPCSAKHVPKQKFIVSVKKALTPHRTKAATEEAAAVTCVKLCKG